MRDKDKRLIDTYFKRNYRRGEALDMSRSGSWSDRPWIEWKNRTLAMKDWQTNGAPFLTKKFKWIPQGSPRTLLREPGENGGAEIHPSHLEFKIFLQDRVEMSTSGMASPRFLLRDDPNSEYQEYEDTWNKLAQGLQSAIFDNNSGITRIPKYQSRRLESIDFVLKMKESGGDWEDLASLADSSAKSGEEVTPDSILSVLESNKLKSTKEEISRIIVKSLISKSTNSTPGENEIFQTWRDINGDEAIIKFYNDQKDTSHTPEDFDLVKRKILDDYELRYDKSANKGGDLWRKGEKTLGKIERLDIHCTGFALVEDLGLGISKLLNKRIDELTQITKGKGMKELKIFSTGDTKKVYNDLFKSGTGIIKNGFGKAPTGVRGKSKDVTAHNSMLMAYNIVNMLLEQGLLQRRKMTEKEYREAFMEGQEDKELKRAAWKEYPNLLVFSKKLKKMIDDCKVNPDDGQENAIYRWMRAPSDRWMYSPPQNHELRSTRAKDGPRGYRERLDDWKPGGFLRPDRRGLVTNHHAYEKYGTPRSLPSEKTVQALNSLQSVQWEINLDLLEKICDIELREGKHTAFLDKNSKPIKESMIKKIRIKDKLQEVFFRPDSSQFNEDRKLALAHVRRIIEHNANVFWHAWSCDFRGRMLPRSNALSPQGNDFDRALIRFKEWKALGDDGIKWLRIHVYNLMKGVRIEGLIGEVPSSKTSFESRDLWVETNIEKLREVASNFMSYLVELELNKTARSKSESFQRLAALIELDRVYTEWESLEEPDWSKVTSGQPVYIDASSNGYQHVSCLLRNRDLAEKVNVIPNSGGTPADLYDLVAEKAKKVKLELDNGKWKQSPDGEPAEKIMRNILSKLPNWSSEDLDRAIEAIFSRSTAKKPTMTRVYGAKDILKSIWGSGGEGAPSWCKQLKDPLTPEEEEARKAVPVDAKDAYASWKDERTATDYWPFANSTKSMSKDGKVSWEIYRLWRDALDEYRYFPVWARGSSLHDGLILKMDEDDEVRKAFEEQRNPEVQVDVARLLGKAMLEAIDAETENAYTSLEASLKSITKIDDDRGWEDRFNLVKPSNRRGDTKYHIYRFSNPDVPIKTTVGGKQFAEKAAKDLIHLHPGPGWILDDGFEVRNYYIAKHHSDKTRKGAPSHPLSAYKEGLPVWYEKKSSQDILKRIDAVLKANKKKIKQEINDVIYLENGQLRTAKKDNPPNRSQMTKIMEQLGDLGDDGKEIEMLLKHRSYSFPRFHEEESKRIDKRKPGTAFAPNFVHSLDALHMRGAIVKFAEETSSEATGFWAVHDAFGTHPSEVERMLRVVKDEFREVHREKDLRDWIREISIESGLNPNGQKNVVKDILEDLDKKIGNLDPKDIATSDFLVH